MAPRSLLCSFLRRTRLPRRSRQSCGFGASSDELFGWVEDEDAVVRGAAHECGRLDVGRAHRQFGCGQHQMVGEQGQRGTGQRADEEYRIWRFAGMTTRNVSSSSRRICLWMRRRLGRRSGALILILCTTLRYDAFTDDESMIGDAIRIQRTPLSMQAACSLTRTWSKAAAPRSRVTGSEHLGTHSESRDTVWTPAKVTDLIAGVEILRITREFVRLYICHLHGYPSSSVWCLLFSKSAPDLTVELSICATDVTSKCGLYFAARDTVEPAV